MSKLNTSHCNIYTKVTRVFDGLLVGCGLARAEFCNHRETFFVDAYAHPMRRTYAGVNVARAIRFFFYDTVEIKLKQSG